MNRLENKVCVITGAGSGIGEESTINFIKNGAKVIAVDCNEAGLENLKKTVVENCKSDENLSTYVADISSSDEISVLFNSISDKYGKIDVLVNNAGITRDATLLKMTDEQFEQVINVNLKGVFMIGRAAAKIMKENNSGSIINTSSVVGVYGNFGQSNYAAAKAGVIGLTKTWAKELGKSGVRVNAVAPGFIQTAMTEKVPEKVLDMMKDKTPLKKLGQPKDVSNLYVFLASDESSYITGQVIGVDGGLVL